MPIHLPAVKSDDAFLCWPDQWWLATLVAFVGRRIVRYCTSLWKPKHPMNLLKSLAAVSSLTMVSRVLGFVRDTIIARTFGAGVASDAFVVAFKLPNLLRRIFAEGAFSQAFVPILAEYKMQQGEEATRTFIAYVSGLLTLVLALVTAIGVLAAPWIVWATAPGFADEAERFDLTVDLLRVTFPYILLIPCRRWPAPFSIPGTASRCRHSCRPCSTSA